MAENPQADQEEVVDHRQGETAFAYYWNASGARSRGRVPAGVADAYCDIWTDGNKEGELCVGTDGYLEAFIQQEDVVLWLKKLPGDRVARVETLQNDFRLRGPSSQVEWKAPFGTGGPESPTRSFVRVALVINHINRLSVEWKTTLRDWLSEQLGPQPERFRP